MFNSKSIHIQKLKLEHIVNGLIIILLTGIYAFLPSIDFLPFRNPTVTGKFVVFALLILIIIPLCLGRQLVSGKPYTINPIDISILLVVGYITLNRYYFQPIFGFSVRFYELLGLLALYFVIKAFDQLVYYYWLLIVIILGADIQILVGWLQLYGFLESNSSVLKVTGGFFNSGVYSGYLAIVFSISLWFLKNRKLLTSKVKKTHGNKSIRLQNAIRTIIFLNIFGCMTLIPALKSRATYIAIFCALAYIYRMEILFFFRINVKRKIIKYVLVLCSLLIVIVSIFFIYNFKKGSSEGRLLILKVSLEMLKDRPLLGFGYDRFRSNYMNYQADYFNRHTDNQGALRASNTVYAFNEPLQFTIENGMLGLTFLFIAVYFLLGRRYDDPLSEIAKTGILSIFVFSLFSYTSEILPNKLMLTLFISILSANTSGFYKSLKIKQDLVIIGIIMIGISLCYFMFYNSLKLAKGFYDWNHAHKNYLNKEYELAVVQYNSILPIFNSDGQFLTDYGLGLYEAGNTYDAINILHKAKDYINNSVIENTLGNCYMETKDYKNAEICYKQYIGMIPGSFYGKYQLFKMYSYRNQKEKAVNVAKEILSLKIKVSSEITYKIRNEATFYLEERGIPLNDN